MNVLIIAYSVDKNDISESQMAFEWISRLSLHANLWVITTGSRLHETCGLESMPNVTLVKLQPRVIFRRFDSFDRAVHPGYVEFYLRARKAVRKVLAENAIDLCHHLAPQSPRFPSPLQGCGRPYIVGPIHGGVKPPAVMKELRGREGSLFLLRKLDGIRNRWDLLLRRTFEGAAVTVASAPYAGVAPPASYCTTTRILPGTAVPLPAKFQRHDSKSDGPVRFIYAGRLVPSKGVELMIEAFSHCTSTNTTLSIYGSGELETFYKELALKWRIDERVQWLGFVSQEQLIEEFSNADVFLFPSLKEAMGTVVLEAMGAGLPVICVDSGGPGYAVTEVTGIKVSLGSKTKMRDDLADAIDRLASSQELRREMGRNARSRVATEFTWDAVVNKMVELYQELC